MRRLMPLLTVLLLGALVVHLLLTGIYSFQYLPVPADLRSFSNSYTAPVFHQNWKMFAPSVPEYSSQLEYRKAAGGQWSTWMDVSASNGFGPTSRIEYIEQTICTSLAYQIANNLYTRDARREFDRIVASFDYGRAIYFTHQLHKRVYNTLPGDSIQLRVQFRFTPAMNAAKTYQYSFLEFPVYSLKP